MAVIPPEVRPALDEDRELWERFVAENEGTLFHSWDWGELVAATTGDRYHRALAFEGDEPVGIACCLDRRRLGGHWALNPLLTPYTGVLLKKTEKPKYQAQRHEARRRHFALLGELQSRFSLIHLQTLGWDMRDYLDLGFRVEPRYTYCVDLIEWEKIWVELEGSTRRQINKARRDDGIELVTDVSWEEAARITRATFEKRGEPCPVGDDLVRSVLENPAFKERRLVLGARDDEGRLLSVVVSIWDSRRAHAHYVHAATDPDALHTGASSWLVWETIKRLSIDGIRVYDFCGANIPGIARFKEGFTPRLVTFFDIEWSRTRWLAPPRRWWRTRGREQPRE